MSGNNPPSWVWSREMKQYYYTIRGNDGRTWHVLEDGRKLPADEPRNFPASSDSGYYSQTRPSTGPSGYTHLSQHANQLADSFQDLALSGQAQQLEYRDVQQGFNPESGVISRIGVTADGREVLLETPGEAERIDDSYRLRRDPRTFYKIGKVFITLWTEPAGNSSGSMVSTVRFGERVYSQIRRFIVVAENQSHCIAVPVTTYGGRALDKGNVNAREHALIYTGSVVPQLRPSDHGIQPVAIQVDPSESGARLDPLSRVNFGKVYTIEHNLKVKPFGVVRNKEELVATFQSVQGGGLYTLREAPAETNIPIGGPGRPGGSRPSGSGGSGGQQPGSNGSGQRPPQSSAPTAQQLTNAARALANQYQNRQISQQQYQAQLSQINHQARAIAEASRQTQIAQDDDDADEDEDEDEDEGVDDDDDDD